MIRYHHLPWFYPFQLLRYFKDCGECQADVEVGSMAILASWGQLPYLSKNLSAPVILTSMDGLYAGEAVILLHTQSLGTWQQEDPNSISTLSLRLKLDIIDKAECLWGFQYQPGLTYSCNTSNLRVPGWENWTSYLLGLIQTCALWGVDTRLPHTVFEGATPHHSVHTTRPPQTSK